MSTTAKAMGKLDLPPWEISAAVQARFTRVGTDPGGERTFRVSRAFAEELGYPPAVLDQLPAGACEAFTGVATTSLLAPVQPGDFVVDLGCGGGLDLALLAWSLGLRGRAVGIDFSDGMVERTRQNLSRLRLG